MKKFISWFMFIFLLSINNVSATVEDDLIEIRTKINIISKEKFLYSHPVGSIYITTNSSENTVDKMTSLYGGTWEVYGTDRALRGTNGISEQTGGTSGTVTMTVGNLPSHRHAYTPSGSVKSTFSGTKVTSGNNSVTPTASFSGTSATTSSSGSHSHALSTGGYAIVIGSSSTIIGANDGFNQTNGGGWYNGWKRYYGGINGNGNHSHTLTASGTVNLKNTSHNHKVTASGSVTSSFTGTAANTSNTGSGTAFSVLDPYITVYMYKRIK